MRDCRDGLEVDAFRTASQWLDALEGNGVSPGGDLQDWLCEHPCHVSAFLELKWLDDELVRLPGSAPR